MTRCGARMAWYAIGVAIQAAGGRADAQGGDRLPSEVLHDVAKGRLERLAATPAQVEAALGPLVAGARTAGLPPEEEVALGMAYFLTFEGVRARPLFEKHAGRDDALGRASWQALQQMTFFGAKDHALVERRTGEYRARFRPVAEDLEHTWRMVRNLAGVAAQGGDHARVVRLILDDVRDLPADLPFRGFDNLAFHFASFQATGRGAEAIALMKRHRDAMAQRLASSAPASPPGAGARSPESSLSLPHRAGVVHLSPFQDWLFEDDPGFSRERATIAATRREVAQLGRWIEAAERGEPIPPR